MDDSELTQISSHLVRRALLETIEDLLQSKDYKIHVTSASKAGENNFIGIIYRISVTNLNGNENESNPITSLILKVAPQNLLRRQNFVIRPAFMREIYSYEKVKWIQLQNLLLIVSVFIDKMFALVYRFYPHSDILSSRNWKILNRLVLWNIPNVIKVSILTSMKD